ncbi:MAG: TfoX/Sxy family protein [Burkholderiales bacterium]|nr:TfoX/Sxy family protein [Burkholderiales bacterium]
MPTQKDAFADHCVELFSALGRARAKRMFSGHGFYVDDLFIALMISGRLYLKTDDESRPRFEAAGCEPFGYETKAGERVVMSYWSAPEQAMESPALMLPWARLAMASALRAANSKRPAAPRKSPAAARKPASRAHVARPRKPRA